MDTKTGGAAIRVTGSAIERNNPTTPSPLVIVDRRAIDAAAVASVDDVLQSLLFQSSAILLQNDDVGSGAIAVSLRTLGTGSISNTSRILGTNHTLVLVNGRRYLPGGSGVEASADLAAIPLAAIERVEVLGDGASALYGSDAVAGVVNLVTRRDFEGTEATLHAGMPGSPAAAMPTSTT